MERRIKVHKRMLKNGTHDNIHLQRSWNKYGESTFSFEVVEYVEDTSKLIEREQFYIENLKTFEPYGFNICRIPNRQTGVKWTKEQKTAQSDRIKKYYRFNSSPMKGVKMSEESRKKMSEKKKRMVGKDNPFYGKRHSEETKQLISEKNKGKKLSSEQKYKISKGVRGENAGLSKLTEKDVLIIIERLKDGEGMSLIAEDYGVTRQTIYFIKVGKTWSHLTGGKIIAKTPTRNSGSKLNPNDVLEIIRLLKENKSCQEIANMFSVRQETINAIKLNKTWKQIPRN